MATRSKFKKSSRAKSREVVDQRLVKALGHPLRVQALAILNERIASPNELAKELGEGLSQVSYHVKVLNDCECIELVKTEPRRGAVEHYYRATSRAFLAVNDWAQLPDSLKPGLSAALLQNLIGDAAAAVKAETFDSRKERHASWTPMKVDDQGWRDIAKTLEETLDRVLEIQAECAERLSRDGEAPIPATVAMLSFETPRDKKSLE